MVILLYAQEAIRQYSGREIAYRPVYLSTTSIGGLGSVWVLGYFRVAREPTFQGPFRGRAITFTEAFP